MEVYAGFSEPTEYHVGRVIEAVEALDVAPTILEAAGIPEPIQVHGVTQCPYEGTSMLYSFNAPDEPERHDLPEAKAEDTVFSGEIKWVELSIGDDDHSHLIEPEDYMHMIMSKQ